MPTFKPILVLLSFCLVLASVGAYTTHMYIPAVLTNQNRGNLTLVFLNVTAGNGSVKISGPTNVSADTVSSAQVASMYAASMQGLNFSRFNFSYRIEDFNTSVSGPSGGLAFTLLAVAGLQNRQLPSNFTATGTISPSGDIGLIGGAYDKAGAAKNSGLRFFLVPAATEDSLESLIYYIAQQTYGIPLVEVSNVSQALTYVFGSKAPNFMSLNLSENYSISEIGPSNLTCSNCDTSDFSVLVNYTANYSRNYIMGIGSNFGPLKQELLGNINSYKTLFNKGYLYTSADFTFLDLMQAFTLANSQNITVDGATSLLDNVSSYCSSLMPPPMTDTNYEFIVGGRMRQIWGNITIGNAEELLNTEQTTDDIIQSVHDSASALGWCKAAYESYAIASGMGGNYIQTSPLLKGEASSKINSANGAGGIYLQAATQAYDAGDYATALYSAVYANVFGASNSSTMTLGRLYSESLKNMNNATVGTWPSQFAMQSEFYFRQSVLTQGNLSRSYAEQAYSTSRLAIGLEDADSVILSSFTYSNSSQGMPQQVVDEISTIKQNISQIYWLLLFDAVMMFVILIILLFHLLSQRDKRSSAGEAFRKADRKRRR